MSDQSHLKYIAWPLGVQWRKKYHTPLFYLLPTRTMVWKWPIFVELIQITEAVNINQLTWYFFNIKKPSCLSSQSVRKIKIVQLLVCPSMDMTLQMDLDNSLKFWLMWLMMQQPFSSVSHLYKDGPKAAQLWILIYIWNKRMQEEGIFSTYNLKIALRTKYQVNWFVFRVPVISVNSLKFVHSIENWSFSPFMSRSDRGGWGVCSIFPSILYVKAMLIYPTPEFFSAQVETLKTVCTT